MKDEKVRPQLNIEIPAELEEVYSNLAVIAHSSSEFVFDFIRAMPFLLFDIQKMMYLKLVCLFLPLLISN